MYRLKVLLHRVLDIFPGLYARVLYNGKKRTNASILEELKASQIAEDVLSLKTLPMKGDTCFILGSGASVNDLDKSEWEMISSNFSIGFNFSFLMEHVPDLYFIELAKDDRGLASKLIERKETYQNVPVAIKGLISSSKLDWAKDKIKTLTREVGAKVIMESALPSTSEAALRKGLHQLYNRGKVERDMDVLVQSKASISMMIDIAARLGYRKVVLLGIDLQGPYFYEETNEDVETGQESGTLLIQRESASEMSIAQILKIQSEFLQENKGVTVYAGSVKSLLREFMPIFSFE
ncbi:hypothetical protein [Phaeocystidibacter luteus]|uniref:DUF115 domain-containing protein n=1 Tax=Phaeocystidibacter luteus TaxID=911197 RepID=A0A6N6RK67_9FLAO|nr:hypothetical protein [Phaeocystidibacter luteus]KAB2814331.1 hypothetical protein F8C67_00950 [Phaeocystidibacter luteus]